MKRGFMLMNTGAPDAPTKEAMGVFLEDFLEDPRITSVPKVLRAPLVEWIVLPHRLEEMVIAYAAIWTDKGDPLIRSCTVLGEKLQEMLGEPVAIGMAHGNPPWESALQSLLDEGIDEVSLIWMFPQHDISKNNCVHAVQKRLKHLDPGVRLEVSPPFYDHPAFIEPLAARLRDTDDYVLFNYHGLSEQSVKAADPTHHHCLSGPTCCSEASLAHDKCYRFQCFATSRAIARAAGIPEERFSSTFQTRHKHGKWLEPHTEDGLKALPAKGVKRLTVINPAFLCDCLETLEEIGLRGKYAYLGAGGESFRMIPCLNDSPDALHCLEALLAGSAQGATVVA